MNKVKTLLVILSLAVSMGAVSAQADAHEEPAEEEAEEKKWGLSFDNAFTSKYIWRGQNLASGSMQPGIGLSYGNFSISSWSNVAHEGFGDDVAYKNWTEHDLTLDYGFALNDKVSANIGFINYAFPNFSEGRYSNEIYGAISVDAPLQPSIGVYGDFGGGKGMYYNFGVGHSVAVGDDGLALNLSASLGINQGQWIDKTAVSDVVLGISFDMPLTDHFTLSPFYNYITGDESLRTCEDCFYYTGSIVGVALNVSY